jgi:hypothetical protein
MKNCLIVDGGSVTGLRASGVTYMFSEPISQEVLKRGGKAFITAFETNPIKALQDIKVEIESLPLTTNKSKSEFTGYKGGHSDIGKGSPEGDGKDKAMREVADAGFIGELTEKGAGGSSTLTSFFGANSVKMSNTNPLLALITDNNGKTHSIYDVNEIEEYPVSLQRSNGSNSGMFSFTKGNVMLARNGKLNGKPLKEKTKESILSAKNKGATFVVGDMPNVDTQFIEYLIEIGAKFEVYHTDNKAYWTSKNQPENIGKSRIDVESMMNNQPLFSKFDTETNPTQDFKDLIQSLSDKLGIPFRYDNNLPYAGAFIDGNVVLNPSKMDETTVWHEFAHPFVQAVRKQNKPLYDNLVNEIYNTPHGKALLADVQKLYSDKSKQIQEEEVIVELIARYASGKIDGFTAKKYKSIWDKVKDFIRSIGKMMFNLGASDVAKTMSPILADSTTTHNILTMNNNMTIKDLSSIMKNGGVILLSNQDVIYSNIDSEKEILKLKNEIEKDKILLSEIENKIEDKNVILVYNPIALSNNINNLRKKITVNDKVFEIEFRLSEKSFEFQKKIVEEISSLEEESDYKHKILGSVVNFNNKNEVVKTLKHYFDLINADSYYELLTEMHGKDSEIEKIEENNNSVLIPKNNKSTVKDVNGVFHNIGAYMNNAKITTVRNAILNFVNLLKENSLELAAWNGLGKSFPKGEIKLSFKKEAPVKQSYLHDVGTKLVNTSEGKERVTRNKDFNSDNQKVEHDYTESIISANKNNIESITIMGDSDISDYRNELEMLSELTGAPILVETVSGKNFEKMNNLSERIFRLEETYEDYVKESATYAYDENERVDDYEENMKLKLRELKKEYAELKKEDADFEILYLPNQISKYQPEIYESRFDNKNLKVDSLKSILSDYGTSYDSFSPQLKSEIETKLTNNPELLKDSNFIKSLTC